MTQSGQGEDAHPAPARHPHEGLVLPADGSGPFLPPAPQPTAPPGWGAPPSTTPPPAPGGWGAPVPPPQQPSRGRHAAPGTGPLPPESGTAPGARPGPDAEATALLPPVPAAGRPLPAAGPPAGPAPGLFPPAAAGDAQATQYLPPVPAAPAPLPAGPDAAPTELIPPIAAGPPALPALPGPDAQATQVIPPVPAAPDAQATQVMPPVPDGPGTPARHLAATQVIPPVTPGALPPEMPAPPGAPAERTHYLGTVPRAGSAPDVHSAPTQHVPQVPAAAAGAPHGERTPPEALAGFDALFRDGAPAPRPAPPGPRPPYPGPPGPAAAPPGRAAARRAAREPQRKSRVPLIAAVGVGLAALGVGTGALLGGGDGEDAKRTTKGSAPVSAAEAADAPPEPTGSAPAPDRAADQAGKLDELLADSGGSRATVISAVADINRCRDLESAAEDLRDAARERDELVTRLAGLSVDRLPRHGELTSALTTAWQASAEADEHYAAWAERVDGKKGCRGGTARQTKEAAAGNRASGEATEAKRTASGLWNAIAEEHGLTTRQPTQL
ncbi:hypothetical protein ACWD6I_09265 [Streptomyces sp. NPDC002454]